MPFVEIPGFTGKYYNPEEKPENAKKYNCADCYCCQMCGDDRCQVCQGIGVCTDENSGNQLLK